MPCGLAVMFQTCHATTSRLSSLKLNKTHRHSLSASHTELLEKHCFNPNKIRTGLLEEWERTQATLKPEPDHNHLLVTGLARVHVGFSYLVYGQLASPNLGLLIQDSWNGPH